MSSFQLKKQGNSLELPQQLLLIGITKAKSVLLELHKEEEYIIKKTFLLLQIAIKLLLKNNKFATLECLPKNKWTTLNDKKIFSNPDTLIVSWLQTSVQGLTGNVKVLKPFWNKQCLEHSKKLWLPTETDCVGLHSSSLSSSSKCIQSNLLFSTTTTRNPQTMNSQKTSCQLSTSTVADKWEKEDTLVRTRKIKIYPTKKQKKTLKKWLGTSRYVYNNALNGIKNNNEKYDSYKLRDKYVSHTFNKPFGLYELFYNPKFEYVPKEWELETPKDIRAGAIRDLCKAYKTCMSNFKNGNINKFRMGFRSKKKSSSIEIPRNNIKITNKKVKIFPRKFNSEIRMSNDRTLRGLKLNHDCRLLFDKNKWFLVIPLDIQKKELKANKDTRCGIDPGVRKFITVYSNDSTYKVSLRKENLKKLQEKLEILQSLKSKKKIIYRRYKRHINKVYNRLDNLIDETHNQTIKILVDEFETIYIPKFESQKLVGTKLHKSTKRNLLQLKHFKFRTKLISKSELNSNKIIVCTEEYTSKTCTCCGTINPNLGCSEVYKCNSCKMILDRDINGARNILIKNL